MIKSVGLAVLLSFFLILPRQQSGPVDANRASRDQKTQDWVAQNYTSIVNQLLPGGFLYGTGVPRDVRWSTTVRILPAFDKPECSLSLTSKYDGLAVASLTTATGGTSISKQMSNLRRQGLNIDQISKKISIRKITVDSREDPSLVAIVRDYESLRFAPALPDYLINDATRYEFWSESMWGAQMRVTLFGAPFGGENQPHPLLTWAERFRRILEADMATGGQTR
ncbi:MAG TPA: hypothetical protein VMI32_15330 [Candidatus Solibacter sp.]|nr:hypothetical protein [Candidatus Solibacter sp.]